MDFVVIDVETANADLSSICQVGIASFREGDLADTWESLVNPIAVQNSW
jgi:DNA polymerase-3 subunit epsilon